MSNTNQDYTSAIPPIEYLWTLTVFAQAGNIWAKSMEKSIQTAKITVSQLATLQALFFSKQPMSPTQISRLLPLETHSVSPLLDRLHKRKLVTRRRSKTSRRAVEVEITDQGRKLLVDLAPSINKVIKDVFGNLTKQDREELIRISHKISYAAADYLGANKKHLDENAKMLSGLINSNPKLKKTGKAKPK